MEIHQRAPGADRCEVAHWTVAYDGCSGPQPDAAAQSRIAALSLANRASLINREIVRVLRLPKYRADTVDHNEDIG